MSENLELELSKQFKASQERYVYFLLAAAASAIGFAMTQSKVEPLAWIHLPLGLSVLLWAVSFFAGLRFVEYSTSVTFQNQNYMAFKRELKSFHEDRAAELLAEFKSKLNKTLERQVGKMKLYGNMQSLCLLCGALLYILWHVLRMGSIDA